MHEADLNVGRGGLVDGAVSREQLGLESEISLRFAQQVAKLIGRPLSLAMAVRAEGRPFRVGCAVCLGRHVEI